MPFTSKLYTVGLSLFESVETPLSQSDSPQVPGSVCWEKHRISRLGCNGVSDGAASLPHTYGISTDGFLLGWLYEVLSLRYRVTSGAAVQRKHVIPAKSGELPGRGHGLQIDVR